MPAKSKSQQRLFGMAYALKKGELSLKDIDAEYRDTVKRLSDSLSLKQLKKFAKTKHKGLPERIQKESYFMRFEDFFDFLKNTDF